MVPDQLLEELTRLGVIDDTSAETISESAVGDLSIEQLTQTMLQRGLLTVHQSEAVAKGEPGSLVIGDYVVLDKLGQGGMGAVYPARHRVMHREVAIKVLPPAAASNEQSVARFLREVRAAARLVHPNIVTAHDAGHSDELVYLVMECVEGDDLGRLLKERGAPLEPADAIDYTLQAAKGLSYAHGMGVIHRDIKPSNLVLDEEGTIKILDMGLARIEQEMFGGDDPTLTQTHAVMGTAPYMPPEQAINAKAVDQRGDIYSLGCTLFQLLTNQYPYQRDTAVGIMLAHSQEPIPALPGTLSADLQRVFEKMVAKQPGDRFQSMDEVIASLQALGHAEQAQAGQDESAAEVSRVASPNPTPADRAQTVASPSPKVRDAPRRRWGIAAGAVGLVVLVVIAIAFLPDSGSDPDLGSAPGRGEGPIVNPQPSPPLIQPPNQPLNQPLNQPSGHSTPDGSYALRFDGDGDFVEIPSLRFDYSEPFTLEVVFQPDRDKPNIAINIDPLFLSEQGDLSKTSHSWLGFNFDRRHREWWVGVSFTEPEATYYTMLSRRADKGSAEEDAIYAGPQHVAIQWDGDEYRLYYQGQLVVKTEGTLIPGTGGAKSPRTLPASLGRTFTPEADAMRYFVGTIQSMRLSTSPRYGESYEPASHFTTDEDTLVLYRFEDGAGEVLTDASGNGHHGKIIGAAWVQLESPSSPDESATPTE